MPNVAAEDEAEVGVEEEAVEVAGEGSEEVEAADSVVAAVAEEAEASADVEVASVEAGEAEEEVASVAVEEVVASVVEVRSVVDVGNRLKGFILHHLVTPFTSTIICSKFHFCTSIKRFLPNLACLVFETVHYFD